ncbi:hypothetical protein Bbelb_373500 [Branchiostoma belcheri]|nr:hypothetical protein Bbelb_373500 [Branchiostoma belcheri]
MIPGGSTITEWHVASSLSVLWTRKPSLCVLSEFCESLESTLSSARLSQTDLVTLKRKTVLEKAVPSVLRLVERPIDRTSAYRDGGAVSEPGPVRPRLHTTPPPSSTFFDRFGLPGRKKHVEGPHLDNHTELKTSPCSGETDRRVSLMGHAECPQACGMSTGISLTHIYAHIPGTLKTCLPQMVLISVTPGLVHYALRGGVRLEPQNRKDRGHPVANLAARPSATSDNVNKHLHKRPHVDDACDTL